MSNYVINTYVSNHADGITGKLSTVFSYDNDDTGTQPAYGLHATNAGTIGKQGTQPAGSTSNELADNGGEIR